MTANENTTSTSRVVVVAGSGRSGTSTIAGVLKLVGLRIPPPEVPGNRTNPRGFFEPRWAVDFQTRLLRKASVVLTDSRPQAFADTEKVGGQGQTVEEAAAWLRDNLAESPELVVKDPRNSWFLPLWRAAARGAGADVAFLTMLRHPAEVVGSKDKYYKSVSAGETPRQAQTTRVASWLNVALFTEVMTRDARRTFVLYNDLLDDWRSVVARVADELGLQSGRDLEGTVAAEVDEFVDPGLRRVRTEWSDIDCPAEIRDLAEDVWQQLVVLAGSGGFDQAAEARLDEVRERYVAMYADAEALAQSSSENARRQGARQGRRKALKATQDAAARETSADKPSSQSPLPARARDLVSRARKRVAARRG